MLEATPMLELPKNEVFLLAFENTRTHNFTEIHCIFKDTLPYSIRDA
jgi:hypothetical protein